MRVTQQLVGFVARLPVSIHSKFLVAFLTLVVLMISLGGLGLIVLGEAHGRAEDAAKLQREVEAYRQLQNDVTAELYGVSSALLSPDDATLEATLRQLNQFGYDFDHLQYVASDESDFSSESKRTMGSSVELLLRPSDSSATAMSQRRTSSRSLKPPALLTASND